MSKKYKHKKNTLCLFHGVQNQCGQLVSILSHKEGKESRKMLFHLLDRLILGTQKFFSGAEKSNNFMKSKKSPFLQEEIRL